jgi:hypothetical protein
VTTQPEIANDRTALWFPDDERFQIRYTYSITMVQSWTVPGPGCAKYRNWPPPLPAPQEPSITDPDRKPLGEPAPSPMPMPCPPPVPRFESRQYTATTGLMVEYDADGKFVAEHPNLPVPVLPKPASPKP